MKDSTVQLYVDLENTERIRRKRDFQQSDGMMPMSRGWSRYRPNDVRVLVRSGNRDVSLTQTQHRVLVIARMHEGETLKARMVADSIGVAPSTVTRALVTLAAFKLIAYDVVRGRYGGVTFVAIAWADLKARAAKAWSTIQGQRQKAWDRYLRKLDRSSYWWSGLNVASLVDMDATLKPGGAG